MQVKQKFYYSRTQINQINYELKIKLDGKRIYPSKFVKYLGILIDPHLNWSYHVKTLAPKLSRSIGMLAKVRHFVKSDVLRNIYFGIFSSILNYGSLIWGQYENAHIKRIMKLQNKAIRIINFAGFREPSSQLYQNSKILKFKDNITLNNFLYVHNSLNRCSPSSQLNTFAYLHDAHKQNAHNSAL